MKKPKILLWLDEPSAGLAPRYAKEMLSKISEIKNRFFTSILIVEQRIGDILAYADRVYIMKTGKISRNHNDYHRCKSCSMHMYCDIKLL